MKKLDKDFYIGSPEEEHIADSIHLFMKGEVAENGEVNKITSVKKVKNGEPIELIGSDSTIDEKAVIYGMLGSNSQYPGIALFTNEEAGVYDDYALTAKFNQAAYYSDTLNYSITSDELFTVIENPSISWSSYDNKWNPIQTPEVFASEEIVSKCKEVFYNYLNNWIKGCAKFAKSTANYVTGTNLPNLGVQLLVLDESAATTGTNKRIYLGTVTGIMRGTTTEEGDFVSITIMLYPSSVNFTPPVALKTVVDAEITGPAVPTFPTIGDDTVWTIEAGQQ